MAVLFVLPSSGAALVFNTESTGQNFDILKNIDSHVNPESETCSFNIVNVVNERTIKSDFLNFNEYMSNDTPSSWGAFQAKSNSSNHQDELSFGSYVLKQNTNITWYGMGSTAYPPHAGYGSQAALAFEHRSYTGENTLASSSFVARADRTIEEGSIGEISFDVMCHLNNTFNSYTNTYDPKAQFHFELDNPANTAETIHLYFQTENGTEEAQKYFALAVYVKAINQTTGAVYNKKIFTGNKNDFNWVNVKLFFDCYNDVYNVSIGQYGLDMSGETLEFTKTELPTALYGQQHDIAYTEIVNTGKRYAPSHVVSALDYWLESSAADGSRSYAYLDNIRYSMLKLPGVYADVIYSNNSIKREYGTGIRWMNRSLITTYEPPKYFGPSSNTPLVFNTNYYDSVSKPGLITTFPQSPSWVYSIPMVVSNNDTLNVLSILDIINDVSHPIETLGRMSAHKDAEIVTTPATAFASQFFELNSTMSETYKYYFNARYSSRVLVVEYYSDIKRAGILKRIQLFPDAASSGQIVYVENGWGNNPDIPDYNVEMIIGFIAVMAVSLVILTKRRLK